MTDVELSRLLKSVGMGCYVDYHDGLADRSVSDDRLISRLIGAEHYTPGASATRVHKARQIIDAGRDKDALALISRSERVAPRVRAKAQELLGG